MRMTHSTITVKGQTTVPVEVRTALKIKPRQEISWEVLEDGTAIVRPRPNVLDLFGSLKPAQPYPGLKEEKEAAHRSIAKRVGGKLPK